MPKAADFQDYLWEVCLPRIRKEMIKRVRCTDFEGETDLHYRLVSFVRRFYPEVLMTAACGEHQETSEQRLDAYKKGYQKGTPDIIVHCHHIKYSGWVGELKSPLGTGVISDAQAKMLKSYRHNNFLVLVSDSYDDLVFSIVKFMSQTRVCRPDCARKFNSEESLARHERWFHRRSETYVLIPFP